MISGHWGKSGQLTELGWSVGGNQAEDWGMQLAGFTHVEFDVILRKE